MYLIIFYLFSQWNVYNYLLIITISMCINLVMVWTYNWLWILNASFKLCSRFEVITAEWGFRSSGMWHPVIVWVVWFLTSWRKRVPSSLRVKQSNFTFIRLNILCFWAGCELETHFFCCWQNINGCDSCKTECDRCLFYN